MSQPILLVVGTRAEAIKLIPVYKALQKEGIASLLCGTYQHATMLDDVFSVFNVKPDFNLNIMKKDQDLFYLTAAILEKTKKIYLGVKPKAVIVHGDTTTTLASALSAFYLNIPIGHVEAGMRTGNMRAPFPEEMNRKVVGQISTYHFAPTAFCTANLLTEGVDRSRVFCTGNTIIDALFWIKDQIKNNQIQIDETFIDLVKSCNKQNRSMMLLTAHRRESFGGGLHRVFNAIKQFAKSHPDVLIFYPTHPNPNVQKALKESGLSEAENVHATGPLTYSNLIYLLMNVKCVATDSGGIQEEAVCLGKKVFVLRDITERWEGVWEGSEVLVGTDQEKILSALEECYNNPQQVLPPSTIYGDGKACTRIVNILKQL